MTRSPLFYCAGVNWFEILKKKKTSRTTKEAARLSIVSMKSAAANSDWNFTNKLHLLEAEQDSLLEYHSEAIQSYDASIAAAKRSGFIHEQGLACEKAGFYYMREKNNEKAVEYFKQARQCYEEWGSSMKVNFIQKELDGLSGQ
jgi:DNA-binding SARP family transcriptional activator